MLPSLAGQCLPGVRRGRCPQRIGAHSTCFLGQDWSHRSWEQAQEHPLAISIFPWVLPAPEPRTALCTVLAAACPIPLPVLSAGLAITPGSRWEIRAELAASIPVHTQRYRGHHNNPAPGENLPTNLRAGEGSRGPKIPPAAPGRSSPVGLRRRRRTRSVVGIKERGSTSMSGTSCRVSGQGPSVIAACQSSCRRISRGEFPETCRQRC